MVNSEKEHSKTIYWWVKVGGAIGAVIFLIQGQLLAAGALGAAAVWANSKDKHH